VGEESIHSHLARERRGEPGESDRKARFPGAVRTQDRNPLAG
jgi:hypothetical protein